MSHRTYARTGWHASRCTLILGIAVTLPLAPTPGASLQPLALDPSDSLPPPDRFTRLFTDEHGLPSGVVFALAQDSAGFLWIGTAGGLARYGGRDFEIIHADLFGGGVHHLATSPTGRVAVVERGRRELWLDGDGDAFEVVRGPDGAPLRDVWWIQFDRGDTLWVIREDGGLLRRGPGGVWLPLPHGADGFGGERLRGAFNQSDGSLLVATRDIGGQASLWRWWGGRRPVKLASVAAYDITAATLDPDGTIWFGSNEWGGGCLYRLRGGKPERLASVNYRKVSVVARGNHIYASDPIGLQILVPGGGSERIGNGGGPLLLDREGSLWLGTAAGLVQYPEPETATWGKAHGLTSGHAEYVAVSSEGVWLSTWQGLGLLERVGWSWRGANVQDIYGAAAATSVCVDGAGGVWLQTHDPDLGRSLSSIRSPHLQSHYPLEREMDCSTTGDGSVLILGDDVIYQATSVGTPERLGELPPYKGRGAQRIAAAADGRVFVAREPHVCDASIETLATEGVDAWTCARLPDVGEVRDLAVVIGPDEVPEPWLASFSGGVLRRADGEWRQIEAMQKIPQRATNGLFASPRGGIWAFGFGFVVRLAPVDGEWEIVEQLGGWQGVAGEIRSLWEEPDGTLWLASWRGVTRVPATARARPGMTPTIRLVALRVDGRRRPPEEAVISPDHRIVEIEFAAGALRDPRRVRYRMRLDGVEWIDAHEPVFRLAGIAPGDHEVEVAASLDGIVWSPSRQLRFHVRHPWYANGWVLAFGAALVASAGVVAHRLRTRHLIELERQRVCIAMDLHDELGAGLGSLGILGGVMADGSAPPEERQRLGEQVARTAAELGGSLHDIVYSLRTGEARIENLAEQLNLRGRTLFVGNGVHFTSSTGQLPLGAIAPSVSRHVYRLAVEALHNAARHAGARHVRLGIEQAGRNGQIRLWVEDDGCGIEPSTLAEPGGMGLLAMRRRAEAIGGDLSIDSNPGRFTRIELTFDGLGRYGHRPSWRNWWQRNRRRAMNDGANA